MVSFSAWGHPGSGDLEYRSARESSATIFILNAGVDRIETPGAAQEQAIASAPTFYDTRIP